jgi:hypothetical protein
MNVVPSQDEEGLWFRVVGRKKCASDGPAGSRGTSEEDAASKYEKWTNNKEERKGAAGGYRWSCLIEATTVRAQSPTW